MVFAEERFSKLKDEVGRGDQDNHPVPNPQFHIPPEVIAELDRLRSMVANSMQVDHDLEIKLQVAQLQGISTLVERLRVQQRVDPSPLHA